MNIKSSKHTLAESILLHLFPGVIIILFYIMIVPIVIKKGFPNDVAILITDFVALVPIELGLLLCITKKKVGTYNIKTQLPYFEKSTVKEYLIFIPLIAIWAILVSSLLNPLEIAIKDNVFAFIPTEYILEDYVYNIELFSKEKLLLTGILSLIANGFVAPIFEELYFRGYLLPRINLSPLKAVVLNAILFSIYHFYSPWYFFSRVLMMIPLYAKSDKKGRLFRTNGALSSI